MLFSSVLIGVGMHHVVATGTCSSTGYSANYGPVPKCPAGTGWWILFLIGGIFGVVIGGLMATSVGLIFGGIFGAIGFGALSNVFASNVQSSTKIFSGVFGGAFALVGVIAAFFVLSRAIGSLRRPAVRTPSGAGIGGASAAATAAPSRSDAFGAPTDAAAAFGTAAEPTDAILGAYNAARRGAAADAPPPPRPTVAPSIPHTTPAASQGTSPTHGASPLDLLPGLQAAAMRGSGQDAVDELSKLAQLHDKGALTDAEFAAAKAKLLERM